MNDVTRMLNALSAGDLAQQNALFETNYAQLRRMASKRMAREPSGSTLQATALVHEA